jgi:hypothetical protein
MLFRRPLLFFGLLLIAVGAAPLLRFLYVWDQLAPPNMDASQYWSHVAAELTRFGDPDYWPVVFAEASLVLGLILVVASAVDAAHSSAGLRRDDTVTQQRSTNPTDEETL